jgi:type II secretory pathway component PulJ
MSTRGPCLKTAPRHLSRARDAFMLLEVIAYLAVVFIVLGVGYAAMYRCMDNSRAFRRNLDDIAKTVNIGDLWRADIRQATNPIQINNSPHEQILRLTSRRGEILYRFSTNAVFRRVGNGPWALVLGNVKTSNMQPEPHQTLTAWRWDLELKTRAKAKTQTRPLFTFIAVPKDKASQ